MTINEHLKAANNIANEIDAICTGKQTKDAFIGIALYVAIGETTCAMNPGVFDAALKAARRHVSATINPRNN